MKHILYQRLKLSTNRFLFLISIVFTFTSAINCTPKNDLESVPEISEISIIPTPAKILYKRDFFKLEKSTRILLNLSDDTSKNAGKYLIDEILKKTDYKLKIADRFTTIKIKSGIELISGPHKDIQAEGFKIVISRTLIKILANDYNGLYYASNVVVGLLKHDTIGWSAPQASIEDYPNIKIRGLYLNIQDSIPNKSQLINLLETNRINYLITPTKWNLNSSTLNIEDYSLLSGNWQNKLIEDTNIKDYYSTKKETIDKVIFSINNITSLHPDSLLIIGEAMWSKPNRLNYNRLVNHLKETTTILKD